MPSADTSPSRYSGTPAVWQPEGFEEFRLRSPATPDFPLPDLAPTRRFAAIWRALGGEQAEAVRRDIGAGLRDTSVVLIRGFLGNCMPGNLVAACRALGALGARAWIARNRAGATVEDNAGAIAAEVRRRVPPTDRLLFLGHSKGGLEGRWIAAFEPDLGARTVGVVLSQTPRGPSAVLESLLLSQHRHSLRGAHRRAAEHLQRLGLSLLRARPGGRALTRDELRPVIERLEAARVSFPLLQTTSWSSRPTAWLDSFHERLGEIRPGCAHDGQFYLEDLIWPGLPHVLLPHLDHAQPVMGGFGFDSARYWLATVALWLEHASP